VAQKRAFPIGIGLDIGTQSARCVIGMAEESGAAPSIVGVGVSPTNGVRKGTVVDIEDTVSAITAAADEAERIAGVTIDHATVGINGAHLLTLNSHGIIAISNPNKEVTEQDVQRAEEAAVVMQMPPNREIIQIFPRNYTLDGQEHIKEPVGMNGMRLEVDACLVTGIVPFIKNLTRAVNQAGIKADSLIANPLAAATALMGARDRDLGVVVIDLGATTTGMAVFEEGEVLHVASIPVGAAHITNDLAIGLRTDIDTAEEVKLKFVNATHEANKRHKANTTKIKEMSGEEINVSRSEISSIAEARLDELFDLINKELRKIKREGLLPAGAIFCGGGANLAGIEELAKQKLRLPARVVRPQGFSGIVDKINDPMYAVAIGLMIENLHYEQEEDKFGSIFRSGQDMLGGLLGRFKR
jgi:cell division protein FtsA